MVRLILLCSLIRDSSCPVPLSPISCLPLLSILPRFQKDFGHGLFCENITSYFYSTSGLAFFFLLFFYDKQLYVPFQFPPLTVVINVQRGGSVNFKGLSYLFYQISVISQFGFFILELMHLKKLEQIYVVSDTM